jgi:hypothetical protein
MFRKNFVSRIWVRLLRLLCKPQRFQIIHFCRQGFLLLRQSNLLHPNRHSLSHLSLLQLSLSHPNRHNLLQLSLLRQRRLHLQLNSLHNYKNPRF